MGRQRDADEPARRWGLVFAMARTWTTAAGKASKNLGTPLPRTYDQRTRMARLPASTGCKTFWVYRTRWCLRHSGDVTGVLSTKGRHVGPKQTKILGTHLDEWTPRQVVCAYPRRWPVEQINRELQTDLGLGEPQVSGEEGRLAHSFGMAVRAYVVLLRVCPQDILLGQPWSVSPLQHAFRLRVSTKQVEHNLKVKLGKGRKVASYLAFAQQDVGLE